MTIEQRKELLSKPVWNYHDISIFFNCGTTKAIQIKNQACKDFAGSIRYMSQYATVESIMQCVGTTRNKEIEILNKLINGKVEKNK